MTGPATARARAALRALGSPARATVVASFLKTGRGQYGHPDAFIGVTVPQVRAVARAFKDLSLAEVVRLLRSRVHEERLLALILMVRRFERGDKAERRAIFQAYRRNLASVNNWDLVDTSAPAIVGGYLEDRDRGWLDELARSRRLWDRRIAIVATQHLIRKGEFADTLRIAKALLTDAEDLIHKAVGWMLREVGKRDQAELERFLARHGSEMPRTSLRYAIERFPASRRRAYLTAPRPGRRRPT